MSEAFTSISSSHARESSNTFERLFEVLMTNALRAIQRGNVRECEGLREVYEKGARGCERMRDVY